ncbi:MAG: hypothetical protein JWL61_5424 [Gemmatimonadetes bacterium]|nr:hypothetical protein [Gemmatimonadota bacterium]
MQEWFTWLRWSYRILSSPDDAATHRPDPQDAKPAATQASIVAPFRFAMSYWAANSVATFASMSFICAKTTGLPRRTDGAKLPR